MQTKFSHW